jgi:hypothetical protein
MTAISTPHGSAHDGTPVLLARYHTLVDVRYAIRALEAKGVDGDDITVVGEAAHTEASTERHRTDRRILTSVTKALVVGLVLGAWLGAVAGAAVMGVVALLWPSAVDDGWVYVLMVGWFAAGGAVLFAIGAIARVLGFSESLALTWEDDPDAPIWLAVYGDADEVRPDVEATRPLEIVDDPVATAHPEELAAPGSDPRRTRT